MKTTHKVLSLLKSFIQIHNYSASTQNNTSWSQVYTTSITSQIFKFKNWWWAGNKLCLHEYSFCTY